VSCTVKILVVAVERRYNSYFDSHHHIYRTYTLWVYCHTGLRALKRTLFNIMLTSDPIHICRNMEYSVKIDNYPVVATYCPPAINTDNVTSHSAASQQWRTAHVRESQYCLQLVRCNDHQCCTPWRSSLQNLLPCPYLPNPVPAKQSGQGIVTSIADNAPTFLPLFLNLMLNSMVQKEKMGEFIIPPYDF